MKGSKDQNLAEKKRIWRRNSFLVLSALMMKRQKSDFSLMVNSSPFLSFSFPSLSFSIPSPPYEVSSDSPGGYRS